MSTDTPREADAKPLVLRVGHAELVISQRYEVASIVNDILVAIWFIAGSIMCFSESLTRLGTWCFLAGSIELLFRPLIRLTRLLHLQRIRGQQGMPPNSQDF